MRTFLTRALWGALLAGGITLLGATAANAAEQTTGEDGLLSGTQALLNVSLPLTIADTSISLLGDSSSVQATAAAPTPEAPTPEAATPEAPAEAPAATTSGENGIASGTQAPISVSLPITVAGNAVSVLGDTSSTAAAAPVASGPTTSAPTTTGEDAILGGTQVVTPIGAPVNLTGNTIAVLGDSATTGMSTPAGPTGATPSMPTTSGADSTAGGTQVIAPLSLPITVGGNAISVIGDSGTGTPTAPTGPGAPGTPAAPGTPGTPATPASPPTSGGAGAATSSAGMVLADAALAETGTPGVVPAVLAAFTVIAAGVGAAAIGHRRGIV